MPVPHMQTDMDIPIYPDSPTKSTLTPYLNTTYTTTAVHNSPQSMVAAGIIHHLSNTGLPRKRKVPQQEKRLRII